MITILFEDNHLLVCDKPAGLLTQDSGTDLPSLESSARLMIQERDQKKGNVYLHAVHRLDREVEGIVLLAKSNKALTRLHEAQKKGEFRKTYQALLASPPPTNEGTLVHYLVHGDKKAEVSNQSNPEAKRASLSYRLIGKKGDYYLVEIELETGRYHQIRAQFAAIGCPLLGDKKYGSKVPFSGIALHHCKLQFKHPVKDEMLVFTSTPKF